MEEARENAHRPRAKRKACLTGQRFGMLTVAGDSGKRKEGCILWKCRCDCGGEILLLRKQLKSGRFASCGCARTEKPKQRPEGNLTGEDIRGCAQTEIAKQRPEGNLMGEDIRSCVTAENAEDLTGQRFGELTVLRRAANDKNNKVRWLCRCTCGKEREVYAAHLKSGHTRSCGCVRYSVSYNQGDLTGQRFGRLTALYLSDAENKFQKGIWHCRCDCGKETDVYAESLLTGATRSCGCLNNEQRQKMHEHMHYQDDTCVERLMQARKETGRNKAGFRGLFLTKSGSYRVMITFRKAHYNLGYYKSFEAAVQARLEAEESLHAGYVDAFDRYQKKARTDSAWAEEHPFFYNVVRTNGEFLVETNTF